MQVLERDLPDPRCVPTRNWASEIGRPTFHHPSRAFTGYLAHTDNQLLEFLFMAYSSWSMNFYGYPSRFDLVIAGDPGIAERVASVCTVVPEEVDPETLRDPKTAQQCFFFPYPDRSSEHYGFFGINQAAFLLDDKIAAMLSKYDLIMKSDFDVFLLPGMVDFFPPFNRMVFGHQAFVLIPEVSEKIRKVAADMGLRVRPTWQHNTGMTSYGHLKELQEIARVMIDALKYMLENTFEQRPQGGPEIDFSGFPGWCMYVLAMYAQEIAANHVLDDFIIDPRLDANSDLDVPTHSLLHIHCQQGAERFNKGYFAYHRYEFLDLTPLNGTISRDCATLMAVGSYRLMVGQPKSGNPAAAETIQAAMDKKSASDTARPARLPSSHPRSRNKQHSGEEL